MVLRRRTRFRFLALVLTGGTIFGFWPNCGIMAMQDFLISVNWTWFLTCATGPLFSGANLLVDCGSSTTTQ